MTTCFSCAGSSGLCPCVHSYVSVPSNQVLKNPTTVSIYVTFMPQNSVRYFYFCFGWRFPFPWKCVLCSLKVLLYFKAVIGRFPRSDFQEFSSCRLEICCHCSRRWVTPWSNQASSWTQPRPAGVMHSRKRSLFFLLVIFYRIVTEHFNV